VSICSLRYPACNAHASYHMGPAPLYIFPHYLINGRIFGGRKLLKTKCGFRVSVQLFHEIVFILRLIERNMIENVYRSSRKIPDILVRF